jgi:hypothetical protein
LVVTKLFFKKEKSPLFPLNNPPPPSPLIKGGRGVVGKGDKGGQGVVSKEIRGKK